MNCFILASPRSGTTWLKTALNIHPEIYCTERQLFGNYADLLDDYGSVTPRLRCTLDKYISSVLRHHNLHSGKESWSRLMSGIIDLMLEQERAASGKDCLVDKITPYVGTCDIVLRRINEFFPNCKLIYLVRDGRDVAVSGIFNWLQKKQNGSRFTAFQKRRADFFYGKSQKKIERFFTDQELSEWAAMWSGPLEIIASSRANHDVLIIHYEDMLESQLNVLKGISSFLDVGTETQILDRCVCESSFKKMSGNRNRGETDNTAFIRKGIHGDWRNYFTRQDAELFNNLCGKLLVQYGYETDAQWLEFLPDEINEL